MRGFVALAPLDMRGSFDALAGAVRRLGLDPVDGHFYLFLNKRRRIAKALWFDGSGWCVLAKRLERGRFAKLSSDCGRTVQLTSTELALFIEGCDLVGRRVLSPGIVKPKVLALDRTE